MKITKRQLRRIIKETASQFAPTAGEEAAKINSQVSGMVLQTDQSYWEEMGITSGEELALSLLSQTYSDLYKSLHGIRPRWESFDTVVEVQAALDDLNQEYENMVAAEELEAQQQAEYERKEKEIEELMPGEFDFQHIPTRSGMGRRLENKIRITAKELSTIIREAMDGHPYDGPIEDFASLQAHKWGHGAVVDPQAWTDACKLGVQFTQGKAPSVVGKKNRRLKESQLRRLVREQMAMHEMDPSAQAAYEEMIIHIREKSRKLSDENSYVFLLELKKWLNSTVIE